jgi:hypothetical protein
MFNLKNIQILQLWKNKKKKKIEKQKGKGTKKRRSYMGWPIRANAVRLL